MNKDRWIFALGFSLLLAACERPVEQAPLADAAIGGPFTLMGEEGKSVNNSQFAGKYMLIYFGYTYCPDICPADMQKLMQGLRTLEKTNKASADKIQPLMISVDPARDTPEKLREWTDAFDPRLIGLTGTEAQIDAVARQYGVYIQRHKDQGENYLVDHSSATMLFGPDGKPIALIPQDKTPDVIAAELDRWVR